MLAFVGILFFLCGPFFFFFFSLEVVFFQVPRRPEFRDFFSGPPSKTVWV